MVEEFNRPATLDDLKQLPYSLNDHGYRRATTDIDVMVVATEECGGRVRAALMVLPDGAAKDLEPTWFEEGENIRVADAFVVDLMLNANGQTFESLRDYAETIDLDGVPVKTLSLEGLLLTKQTMRDKDVLPTGSSSNVRWPSSRHGQVAARRQHKGRRGEVPSWAAGH